MTFAVAHRTFDTAEQARFAMLTGDVNPMHVDPLAARRTQAGSPVVHGVNALLWAIDALCAAGHIPEPISSIDAEFQKFVYVDAAVGLEVTRETASGLRAEIRADGLRTIKITIGWEARTDSPHRATNEWIAEPTRPADLTLDDIRTYSGRLQPANTDISDAYPKATSNLGRSRIGAIARLSTLVGMVSPGLHSIFSGLRIRADASEANDGLAFGVNRLDDRFRLVELAVSGSGINGTVSAFVRQPPIAQVTAAALSASVAGDEFAGVSALIIGGSRGLGSFTARAIVAGGGRVVITYAVGESDARTIAEELGPDHCRVMRYDARAPAESQLSSLSWPVNQLYYFASSQIFRQKTAWFVPERYDEFSEIYVTGFARICIAMRTRSSKPLAVFYPSSTLAGDRIKDTSEYGIAKAAGELLCADLERFVPGIRVVISRLPRILTDQTATVMPVESSDAATVMLPIIRDMLPESAQE